MDMLDVKKEVQRNDCLVEFLEEELHNVGLHTTTEFHNNNFSIFVKWRPDLAFYKESTSWIKAGIIMQQDQLALCGAAFEFKMDIFKIMKMFCLRHLQIWYKFQMIC